MNEGCHHDRPWGLPKSLGTSLPQGTAAYTNEGCHHRMWGLPKSLGTPSSHGLLVGDSNIRTKGATTKKRGLPKSLGTSSPPGMLLELPIAAARRRCRGTACVVLPTPLISNPVHLVLLTDVPPAHPHAAVARP